VNDLQRRPARKTAQGFFGVGYPEVFAVGCDQLVVTANDFA
jgi:hypothetical protein